MTSRIFIHLFIMKLWSNYLQHTGNQRISLYKASLQSIQNVQKWQSVSQTLLAHHQFLHFHTSIFHTKKFFWQTPQCQEKRTSCNSSQNHRPAGVITSLFSLQTVLRETDECFTFSLTQLKTGSLEGQCQQQWLSETSVPKGASFGSSQ